MSTAPEHQKSALNDQRSHKSLRSDGASTVHSANGEPTANSSSGFEAITSLGARLRELGIVLLGCLPTGEIAVGLGCCNSSGCGCAKSSAKRKDRSTTTGSRSTANGECRSFQADWLAELVCASPMARKAIKDVVSRQPADASAANGGPCAIAQAMPGVWVSAFPMLNRRRLVGYAVAVIATSRLLDAEQLDAMCQSARMDSTLCRRKLVESALITESEVPRMMAMVQYAMDDQMRIASDAASIESVGQQLAESYEEVALLMSITQSMIVQERPERFVALACQELLATLPYTWIGTQLADDRSRLKSLSGQLILAGQPGSPSAAVGAAARKALERFQRTPSAPLSAEGQRAHSGAQDSALVLEPATRAEDSEFAALGRTALVQPVSRDGVVIGVLIAGDKQGRDTTASSVDLKLLGATATHMAIFFENANLYDNLQAMFLGTLEALTASIDAKDRYTCGHSRRVAHLTAQLAAAVGLDEREVSRCRIAGLVHDVGKIGVPEAVLLKPGKLDAEEFAWIRRHPEIGYRILKDIPQLQDVLPGVLHHHERWDGAGYPAGLRADGIPLMARLIGLADSFDAMSSTRTYRSALSRQQVLDEIARCAGAQFDPELARAFVKLDFSDFDRLVAEHQAGERADEVPAKLPETQASRQRIDPAPRKEAA